MQSWRGELGMHGDGIRSPAGELTTLCNCSSVLTSPILSTTRHTDDRSSRRVAYPCSMYPCPFFMSTFAIAHEIPHHRACLRCAESHFSKPV